MLPKLEGSLIRVPIHGIQIKLPPSILLALQSSPSISINLSNSTPSLNYGNFTLPLSIASHSMSDLIQPTAQEIRLCKIQSIAKILSIPPIIIPPIIATVTAPKKITTNGKPNSTGSNSSSSSSIVTAIKPKKAVVLTTRVTKTVIDPTPVPSKRANLLEGEKERKKRKLEESSTRSGTPIGSVAATPISSPRIAKKEMKEAKVKAERVEKVEKVKGKTEKKLKGREKYEFTDSEPEEGEVLAESVVVAVPSVIESNLSAGLIEFYRLEYLSNFSTYSALSELLMKEKSILELGGNGNLGLNEIKELTLKLATLREILIKLGNKLSHT